MIRLFAAFVVSLLIVQAAFAQPALERVEKQLRGQLRASDTRQPGYLGVVGDEPGDGSHGIIVLEAVAGGPAAQAGIMANDLILAIDGQSVERLDELSKSLQGKTSGTAVTLQIERQGATRELKVTLGQRAKVGVARPMQRAVQQPGPADAGAPEPPMAPAPRAEGPKLGVRTLPISEDAQRQYNLPSLQGALVTAILAGSPAEKAGIPVGVAITAVDSEPVDNPEGLATIIRDCTPGQTLELTYNVGQEEKHKRVKLTGGMAKSSAERIEQLERRVVELEEHIEKLEAELAKKN